MPESLTRRECRHARHARPQLSTVRADSFDSGADSAPHSPQSLEAAPTQRSGAGEPFLSRRWLSLLRSSTTMDQQAQQPTERIRLRTSLSSIHSARSFGTAAEAVPLDSVPRLEPELSTAHQGEGALRFLTFLMPRAWM
jgi:hypothetical protein